MICAVVVDYVAVGVYCRRWSNDIRRAMTEQPLGEALLALAVKVLLFFFRRSFFVYILDTHTDKFVYLSVESMLLRWATAMSYKFTEN